jgi:serine/threonine protein kinase
VDNPIWLAPEILLDKEYDEKVDTYAFGIILWELVSREIFFSECSFMLDIQDKVASGERPVIPTDIPSGFTEVIRKSWVSAVIHPNSNIPTGGGAQRKALL